MKCPLCESSDCRRAGAGKRRLEATAVNDIYLMG
jgi:hypothetical protein